MLKLASFIDNDYQLNKVNEWLHKIFETVIISIKTDVIT